MFIKAQSKKSGVGSRAVWIVSVLQTTTSKWFQGVYGDLATAQKEYDSAVKNPNIDRVVMNQTEVDT